MKEQLNKISAIKADIKSALIDAGVSDISDVFADYPRLIKSLSEDIYSTYFELIPDEYVEIEEDGYIVKREKYKYIYSDDIFVEGHEISREEKKELTIDVETVDGSEIIIEYSGGTLTTENGKLYGEYPGEFKSVKNLDKAVNLYINTDNLPGEALDYKVQGSKSTNPNENIRNITLICKKAKDISHFAQDVRNLVTFNIYASVNLEDVRYLVQCQSGLRYLSEINIYDAPNVWGYSKMCHNNSQIYTAEKITLSLHKVKYLQGMWCRRGFRKVYLYGGPFSNHIESDDQYAIWDAWNYGTNSKMEELYGMDVSEIEDQSYFRFFSGSAETGTTDCTHTNLVYCKIDGLGVGNQIIGQRLYPANSVWAEEDIIYSFSRIAPTDNPEAKVCCSDRVRSVFEKNEDLVGLITERGYSIVY